MLRMQGQRYELNQASKVRMVLWMSILMSHNQSAKEQEHDQIVT